MRAVALARWIEPRPRRRRSLLVGPRPGAAAAPRRPAPGLENIARTLSIEWARHGVRHVRARPGPETTDAEVAALVAFLASPAGAYVSGTVLATA